MTQTRQLEDLDLWRQWRSSKSPVVLSQLLDRLTPIIQNEVNKWGTVVPRIALESKARELTVKALDDYSPTRGAAIGTHVTSRLRKLSRFVYPYQNIARLPENKQLLYNTFQVATNRLLDTFGRDPTVAELADELGWTSKKVTSFKNAFGRQELVESEGAIWDTTDKDAGLVDFYYHGLSPDDKKLFEDLTGYKGLRTLTTKEVLKKFKLTQGQLSYRKRKFVEDIKRIQSGKV